MKNEERTIQDGQASEIDYGQKEESARRQAEAAETGKREQLKRGRKGKKKIVHNRNTFDF